MKRKKLGIWAMILTLILVSVPFGVWKVMADTPPPYTIRILEVSDTARFKLKSALAANGATNVTVDTMRMKTFVAQRDELAGKYDIVYFGQGAYSPDNPQTFKASSRDTEQQKAAHNTSSVMNDITEIKAQDIQEDYINNGLTVVFFSSLSSSAVNYDSSSKLSALYKKNALRSNVVTVASDTDGRYTSSDLTKFAARIKTGEARFKQRPLLDLTAAPSASSAYKAGQKINFNFNVYNANATFANDVNVKLYVSVDKVLKSTDDNLVASTMTTGGAGALTYTVPNTYSGPLYWRMEATFAGTTVTGTNAASGLTDTKSGMFMLLNNTTVIRVLQVMTDNTASDLTNKVNMTQSYLKSSTKGYDIQITPITFTQFMDKSVYGNLNGKYDMILFGFADSYGRTTNSKLTADAAAAVNKFIETGQAVMFTHDTILVNSDDTKNKWSQYFGEVTGQNYLLTNLGYANPDSSSLVKEVNSGMLTQFPFDLRTGTGASVSTSQEYQGTIASTHNQYYMVDLNNPDIVPWYNISSTSRDTDDSWDHYYTYSDKNVTYSGTGHTNTGFPDWEQRLFVNTMYRAYIGSNHAPEVTIYAPEDQSSKPSYLKNLTVSYKVDDLDLNDLYVYSTVRFKNGDTYLTELDSSALTDQKTLKGTTITKTVANPFPNGGNLTVEITAHDANGAKVVKTSTVAIKSTKATLEATRSFVSGVTNAEAIKNQPVVIGYKVVPTTIEMNSGLVREDEKGIEQLTVSNVKFTEKLPANLEVVTPLPTGMTKSGTLASGYTLAMDLGNFDYKLTGSGTTRSYTPIKPAPLTFNLTVKPVVKGFFNLDNAGLAFEDLHADGSGGLGAISPIFNDYSALVLESSNTAGNFSADGRVAIRSIAAMNGFNIASSNTLSSADPSVASLTVGSSFSPSGFTVKNGSVVVQGDAKISNFTVANGSLDVKGDLNLSGSGMSNGAILVSGNLNATNVGFNVNTAVGGSLISTGGGVSKGTLLTGADLEMKNFSVASGASASSAGNLRLGDGSINGSVTYGGTYTRINQTYLKPTQGTASTIRQQLAQAQQNWATKGIIDFDEANRTMLALSDNYAAMAVNGKTEYLYSDTQVLLTGKDSKVNVFTVDGSRMQKLTNFTIDVPAGSSTIVNITGNSAKLSQGFKLNGADANHVLINYPINGILDINSVGVQASVLAPRAEVRFNNGNMSGTLVARKLTGFSALSIGANFFQGNAPVKAAEPGSVKFNDLPFTALVKVDSITLQNQTLWIGDKFQMPASVQPVDVDNSILQWESSAPSKVSVDGNGTLTALSTTAANSPVAIKAKATDGSGKEGIAYVTVMEPGLQIAGPQSVNVGETIRLTVAPSNTKYQLSGVTWSLIGSGDDNRAKMTYTGSTASVVGNAGGQVMVRVDGILTNAGVSRPYSATQAVTVINNLSNVRIEGQDWVPVGGSITLDRIVEPADANIAKTAWTVTSAATSGSGTIVPAASTINPLTATLTGQAPGKVEVKATVTAAGTTANMLSGNKEIRVVDLNINGPSQLFKGQEIPLTAVFDTYDPNNWSGKPEDYVWSVINISEAGHQGDAPYAAISNTSSATPTLSGNKPGKVTVTLTVGGMTETKTIEILPKLEALQLVSPIEIKVGEQLDLLTDPTRALNIVPNSLAAQVVPKLVWSSSNESAASVDNNGKVIGVQPGTTIVTVTYPAVNGFPAVTARTQINVISPEQAPNSNRY